MRSKPHLLFFYIDWDEKMVKNDLVTIYFSEDYDEQEGRFIGNLDDFDEFLFEDFFVWNKDRTEGTLDKDVFYIEGNDNHSEWMIVKMPEYILDEIKGKIEALVKKYCVNWKVLGREVKD
jgi:hypothetical protein